MLTLKERSVSDVASRADGCEVVAILKRAVVFDFEDVRPLVKKEGEYKTAAGSDFAMSAKVSSATSAGILPSVVGFAGRWENCRDPRDGLASRTSGLSRST
jgi:hypothetical protein